MSKEEINLKDMSKEELIQLYDRASYFLDEILIEEPEFQKTCEEAKNLLDTLTRIYYK